MMPLHRLTALLTAALCLGGALAPQTHYAAAAKPHWALSSLETLQKQHLLLDLNASGGTLDKTLTEGQFQAMLTEIWASESEQKMPALPSPDQHLNRQEAAEQLFGLLSPSLDQAQTDAVRWVLSAKLMNGYPGGDFKPEEKLTHAQGVVIMKPLKDYLSDLTSSNAEVTYSVKAIGPSAVEFTLSWGEKPTGGYSVAIHRTELADGKLHIYYSLSSPKPGSMNTQAFTYPKAVVKLDMSLETYQGGQVVLHRQ